MTIAQVHGRPVTNTVSNSAGRPSTEALARQVAQVVGLGALRGTDGAAGTIAFEFDRGTVLMSGNSVGESALAKVEVNGMGDVPVSVVKAAGQKGLHTLRDVDGALGTHYFHFANGTVVTHYNDAGELEVTRITRQGPPARL